MKAFNFCPYCGESLKNNVDATVLTEEIKPTDQKIIYKTTSMKIHSSAEELARAEKLNDRKLQ